jgi:hypothetical protein
LRTFAGLKTIFGFGPKVAQSVQQHPDGLLLHENVIWSVFPLHGGFRQYWRDYESMERWARSEPHRQWWKNFLHDSGGTAFWHEAYFMRGGMEAVYDDLPQSIGFMRFAPVIPARGPMFSARQRVHMAGTPSNPAPVGEAELYGESNKDSTAPSK